MDTSENNIPEHQPLAPKAESYAPVPKFKYSPSQREIDFAQLVAVGGDPIQALVKSGILSLDDAESMKRGTVYNMATRLLSTEAIQERLDYFRILHSQSMEVTAERILQEAAAMAFMDVAHLFDAEKGLPITNPHLIPRHARAAIKEMYTDHNGTTRVKLHDKMKPLEMLADFEGMLNDAHAAKATRVTVNLDSGGSLPVPPSGESKTLPDTSHSMPPESNDDDIPDCLR